MKLHHSLIYSLTLITLCVPGQAATVVFQDDFSSQRSEWNLSLQQTQNNPTAIAASYAVISGGYLSLKANVGTGWNFLLANAALDFVLPSEFTIEYRARKTQWAGHFYTLVTRTFEPSFSEQPSLERYAYGVAGSDYLFLGYNSQDTGTVLLDNPGGSFDYGIDAWHVYTITKTSDALTVDVDGVQKYSSSTALFDGGYFMLSALQAGSTVDVDYVTIAAIPEPSAMVLCLGSLSLVVRRRRDSRRIPHDQGLLAQRRTRAFQSFYPIAGNPQLAALAANGRHRDAQRGCDQQALFIAPHHPVKKSAEVAVRIQQDSDHEMTALEA